AASRVVAGKQVVVRDAGDNAEGASKRRQEWQPKQAAAEEEETSGAVPTEEEESYPKRDEADGKPS
ncbi:hypothetical protein ACJX0J_015656, partial [Zea mays]